MLAAPPTTVAPSGPAGAGAGLSAMSGAGVSRKLLKRGCMARVPLQPSAQDEEEPRVFPWPLVEQARQRRCADQALALRDLRHGQISGYRIEPSQTSACPKRGCIHALECAWNRGKIMEPDLVEEAVELRQGKCR